MDQQLTLQVPSGTSVMIGVPMGGTSIPLATCLSLIETAHICGQMGVAVTIVTRSGAHVISRDAVLTDFLNSDEQLLFWIDSDMAWDAADFIRLVALALIPGRHIVGCGYPAKVEGATTYYANFENGQTTDELGLIKVKGLGLGFTVCSREAMVALAATKEKILDQISGEQQVAAFRFDTHEGQRRTEDMAFFADLTDLGYTVWLDPHVELGHVGPREWRGRMLDALVPTE